MNINLPYCSPTEILEYIDSHPVNETGEKLYILPNNIKNPTISDYYESIKGNIDKKDEYKYYSQLLKMFQLLTNEGLISPVNAGNAFEKEYQLNSFNPASAMYGQYDFLILGFQKIREKLRGSVRPIILDRNDPKKNEDIGTGFYVNKFNGNTKNNLFVTAKHCLKENSKIQIPICDGSKINIIPEKIFVSKNDKIDIAVLTIANDRKDQFSEQTFWVSYPNVLDEILTLGYPRIQGFTEAIQIAETSLVSAMVKGSKGQITGEGIHYHGGLREHLLISARVKGGNSGSPVINKLGEVVGVLIELLEDEYGTDLLGYGVALSSIVLSEIIKEIKEGTTINIKNVEFENFEDHFIVKNQNE